MQQYLKSSSRHSCSVLFTVAGRALLVASIINDCSTLHYIPLLNDRHANLEINLRFSRFHVSVLLCFCGFYKSKIFFPLGYSLRVYFSSEVSVSSNISTQILRFRLASGMWIK